MRGGVYLTIYGGVLSLIYKKVCDNGLFIAPQDETYIDKVRKDWSMPSHYGSAFHWKWKGWSLFDRYETEPAWKKWEDKEAAKAQGGDQ